MVRRRLLSSSAKQASMSAYQNFWQQQQHQRPQSPLVVSMPQYWHSMCHKLGGAAASVGPPRRQLVKQPREADQQPLPLPRDYQTVWGRCCGTQGPLLKPGASMPTFPHLGYRHPPPTTRAVAGLQPQRSFQGQQGNFLSYPAAVQMHQMWHQQQQQQQPQGPLPVGILKKTPQLESAGVHNGKRVTIKAPDRYQAPTVEPLKPRPELPVPRRTSKRMRQHLLRREQQKVLQHQMFYQKQLQKQQQAQKELRRQQRLQRRLQKKQEQQHRQELEKVQQQMQQHRMMQHQLREASEQHRKAQRLLERRTNYFNFGKTASSFLENSEPETFRAQKPENLARNQNFSYQETKKCLPEVPRNRVTANKEGKTYSTRFKDPQDLGNESSTITLTTAQSLADCEPARTPYRSGTSLVDRATNTPSASMSELLKEVPLMKATSDTGRARKVNINELLRSEQVKGLNADPMCQSLMQLVTHMCKSQEDPESRLKAGCGGDDGGRRKQYSVYLMVTSEDEDEGEHLPRSEVNGTRITGGDRIQGEHDEFSQRCGKAYQDEYPRLGRRKRTRRSLSSRLDDLECLSSGPLPFLPMRRPLHWPKPDYSKLSQGRSNRSRTPTRIRSHSSSKPILQMRSPRSVGSVLDPKNSWKLWEDLPMTAKTLNKAYSRLWSKSGGQSCTKF